MLLHTMFSINAIYDFFTCPYSADLLLSFIKYGLSELHIGLVFGLRHKKFSSW